MVEEQIARTVDDQVLEIFSTNDWLQPIEQKIVKYTQDRILGKFSNSSAMPEIVDAVKNSVSDLFADGKIPGVENFVDPEVIRCSVDRAVESMINSAVEQLSQDSQWLEKVEKLINQAVVQRTVASLGSIDINTIIHQRVDENMLTFRKDLAKDFSSTGISDQATQCQLTVMDEVTVVENKLTAKDLEIVGNMVVKDLVVKGSINTDNKSWQALANDIGNKTLEQLDTAWRSKLITQVTEEIEKNGINFNSVKIDGHPLVDKTTLSKSITESNIQTLGILKNLKVQGEAHIYNTVSVVNKRLGINTAEPEMALSVWDEEVSVVIGKNKSQQAYIGTNRDNSVAIGVNRLPQIELDIDGMTTIKKLRVGLHKISHATEVPGYAGTKGDVVFNANPGVDNSVFAWVCLGGHKWKTIRSVQ